jgi:hypothetical protein
MVSAWGAAGKRLNRRREDFFRDAGVAAIVHDLHPDALLYVHGPVPEIVPRR